MTSGLPLFANPADLLWQTQRELEQANQKATGLEYELNQVYTSSYQKDSTISSLQNTIQSLYAQLARYKNEEWEYERTFFIDPDGKVFSIEPNNRRKPVGSCIIKGIEAVSITRDETECGYFMVQYQSGQLTGTAMIPMDDVTRKPMSRYFDVFYRTGSKALANEFFYWVLMQYLNSGKLSFRYYPELPGVTLNVADDQIESAQYICYDYDAEDIQSYLSETYAGKILPLSNQTGDQLLAAVCPYLNKDSYILLSYGLAGLLATYLDATYNSLSMMLTVSTKDIDGEALASCLLKTYNRCDTPPSITMTKTQLTALMRTSKDEVVVLKDDTTSKSDVKRSSALDTLRSFGSDKNYKPFYTAILSDTIHLFMPPGSAVHLEPVENFGKGISAYARHILGDSLDGMYRLFIDTFCSHITEYGNILNNHINQLKSIEHGFSTEGAKTTYAVLYSVLLLWADIFHTEVPDNVQPHLIKLIYDAENLETGKDLAIVNEFIHTFNQAISSGVLSIKELTRDMGFEEGKHTLIHDGDFMLIEELTVREVFLPNIKTAATVNNILSALQSESYLVSTNGHRKPTTVYDKNRMPQQKKLIAFQYKPMVTPEILQYIDCLQTKQFFSNVLPNSMFIPLIRNSLGSAAGQLLTPGSNQHRFITGKSGSGKTVFLTQLLYSLSKNRNRVVVFDANSSFTYEELLKVLPEHFIEKHITFFDTTQNGSPINIFHTYDTDKPLMRQKMLFSILCAAIKQPSQNQEIALKNIVKRMANNTDHPTYIDLLDQFDQAEDLSEKSIVTKLSSIFEDLVDNESEENDDWAEFLANSKDIVVISLEDDMSENGNQLMDILLASLFHAQCHETEQRQLSIIIDEIHGQNTSEKSMISKILREGRKHLIDLNFATQYAEDAKQNRLFKQAGLSIYFQPDLESRAAVANMLGLKRSEQYRLDELERGMCFVQGPVYNFETGVTEETVINGTTYLLKDSPLNF